MFPRVPKPFSLGLLYKLLLTHPSPSGGIAGGGARLACLAAACPTMLTWRDFFSVPRVVFGKSSDFKIRKILRL